MKAKKAAIPHGSMVGTFLPADYLDVYMCSVNGKRDFLPDDIMVHFWTNLSGWVSALFRFRNFLVKRIGLKSSEDESPESIEKCIRSGSPVGFLSVAAKSEDEVVLLMTDKHLDAYLAVYVETPFSVKKVFTITAVHFHNQWGRFYFWVIRPFHRMVVKSMLKRALKEYQ